MHAVNRFRRGPVPPTLLTTAFALLLVALAYLPAARAQQWTTNTNGDHISNANAGNVGIGTSSPASTLHIANASTGAVGITLDTPGSQNIRLHTVPGVNNWGAFSLNANYNSGWSLDDTTSNGWFFKLDTRGGNGDSESNGLWLFRIPNGANPHSDESAVFGITNGRAYFAGNVGVGTTAPQNQLHVNNASGGGSAQVSGSGFGLINFKDASAPADAKLYQWSAEGGLFRMTLVNDAGSNYVQPNLLVANAAGNVGVGTAAPAHRLHVVGGGAMSVDLRVNGRIHTGDGGGGGGVWLDGGQTMFVGQSGANLGLWTSGAGFGLQMTNDGKVGIGTGSPTKRLHVVGDVEVTGNIAAKYQDVAEWVPSTQKLAAGTVVVLDQERSNHVLASTAAYDTRVAGVVSAQPGLILGEAGDGKLMVATTGRVKVMVDATRAPVRIGDLLVTSDAPGLAMRSEPIVLGGRRMHAPGTIIGKALEPLAQGTGEILVLLSMQ